MTSIELTTIAKDCKGNLRDDDGKLIDPITHDPMARELITIVKVGNLCYNRETLRNYLLSKDPEVGMNLDSGDSIEYSQGASGIINDPFTNVPFTDDQLKLFHELVSEDRSRAASPAAMNLNESAVEKRSWKKAQDERNQAKGGRRSRKRSNKRRSRRNRRSKRSRRSNKKRK